MDRRPRRLWNRTLRVVRYLWAAPTTLLGLSFLPLAWLSGGRARIVRGVVEVHGGLVSLVLRRFTPLAGGASAMTLGHVVLGRDAQALRRTRAHERVHVAQCERWGPLFIPAYFLASGWALLLGGHPYLDNAFEREAFRRAGPLAD